MALLFLDAFDDRTSAGSAMVSLKYDAINSASACSSNTGRTGSALGTGNGGFYARKVFSAKQTWIVGFAAKVGSLASATNKFLQIMDGATSQVYLEFQTTTGLIKVYRGDGTLLATASGGALSTTAFVYIEFKVTIDNTVGAFELRVDGVNVASATGVDTQNSANASATTVSLEWNAISGQLTVDDYYICDGTGSLNNDFLGPIKIERLVPNAAGTTTGWSRAGAGLAGNYDAVNEASTSGPNDDTDYVFASAVGTKDTYGLQDMSATAGTVIGIQTTLRARRDDLAVRGIKPVTRSGGTDYLGSEIAMTGSYVSNYLVQETDPATGNPFTISAVNALEIGV